MEPFQYQKYYDWFNKISDSTHYVILWLHSSGVIGGVTFIFVPSILIFYASINRQIDEGQKFDSYGYKLSRNGLLACVHTFFYLSIFYVITIIMRDYITNIYQLQNNITSVYSHKNGVPHYDTRYILYPESFEGINVIHRFTTTLIVVAFFSTMLIRTHIGIYKKYAIALYIFFLIFIFSIKIGDVKIAKLLVNKISTYFHFYYGSFSSPDFLEIIESRIEKFAIAVGIFLLVYTTIKFLIDMVFTDMNTGKIQGQDGFDVPALGKAANVVVWIIAFILSLGILGIDLVGLGLFSGLIGAGLSISFRDLLNNAFSGLFLHWDKSIKPGDTVRLDDGTTGQVNKISLRYTFINTPDNIDILIPNSYLASNKFRNLTRTRKIVRLSFRFEVGQLADISLVRDITELASLKVPQVANAAGKSPATFYLGSQKGAHQFDLRFWVDSPDIGPGKLQSEVAYAVFEALKENKISHSAYQVEANARIENVWIPIDENANA